MAPNGNVVFFVSGPYIPSKGNIGAILRLSERLFWAIFASFEGLLKARRKARRTRTK